MRNVPINLTLGGSLLALALVVTSSQGLARSAPPDGISLMETLAEWKYPGSKWVDGATMSDGGAPPAQAVKCKSILVTPDPIEKVIAFYNEKLGTGEAAKGEPNAVSVQDDSKGRPVTLRVFVVNKVDTSTTLVISRAEGEKETHIAWSHHIRLAPGGSRAEAADGMQVTLVAFSGRRNPTWSASAGDVKSFAARFAALGAEVDEGPLKEGLGYHGFEVARFRNYERIRVWNGLVEATRDGKVRRWRDEGKALERSLLGASKEHLTEAEYKMAASEVEKE